ncbi:hypothetical protein MASR2M39_23440 [Ignavibacteriales bacterium]
MEEPVKRAEDDCNRLNPPQAKEELRGTTARFQDRLVKALRTVGASVLIDTVTISVPSIPLVLFTDMPANLKVKDLLT